MRAYCMAWVARSHGVFCIEGEGFHTLLCRSTARPVLARPEPFVQNSFHFAAAFQLDLGQFRHRRAPASRRPLLKHPGVRLILLFGLLELPADLLRRILPAALQLRRQLSVLPGHLAVFCGKQRLVHTHCTASLPLCVEICPAGAGSAGVPYTLFYSSIFTPVPLAAFHLCPYKGGKLSKTLTDSSICKDGFDKIPVAKRRRIGYALTGAGEPGPPVQKGADRLWKR